MAAVRDEPVRLGVLLGLVVGSASLLFPIVSALAPLISEDLELSRFELGTVATTYFGVGAVVSMLVARAVDAFGTRLILRVTLIVTAAGMTGVALSPSHGMLLSFAVLGGVALSASNPVTNAVIVERLPAGERGTVMGLKHAGVPTTGAVVSLVLPAAAVAFGWRGVVLCCAVVVLLLVPVVAQVGTGAPVRAAGAATGPATRPMLWIGFYAWLMGAAGGATNLYLPLYGHEKLGLSVTMAGAAAAAAQITAVGSRVVWTRMSERSLNVGRPLAAVSLCALAAVAPLVAAESAGPALFWIGAVAIGAGMLGWTPVAMLAAIRLAEPGRAGRASGVVVAGFYFGFMVGPAVFGHVVDTTGDYAASWLLAAAVFTAAAALALVCGRRAVPTSPNP